MSTVAAEIFTFFAPPYILDIYKINFDIHQEYVDLFAYHML